MVNRNSSRDRRIMPDQEQHPNTFYAVVRGRVQRVGYRVFARECAHRHKIRGWVRNLPDGGVELRAEGDELSLTEFLTDLYRGPVLSHVEHIDLKWEHSEPECTGFSILR